MTTIILNHQPYDGSDVTWNALRLAKTLHQSGEKVNIFLMNDAVDLARDMTKMPEGYDHDLVGMQKNFMKRVYRFKYVAVVMHDAVCLRISLILMRVSLQRCKFLQTG